MTRRTSLPLALCALLAFAPLAGANPVPVTFLGGAWTVKKAESIDAWTNSPEAAIALDNRNGGGSETYAVHWRNLIPGTFLATPEGVVLTSARERTEMPSSLTVPPGERQDWRLNPNVNGSYRFAVISDTENAEDGQRVYGALSKDMAAQKVRFVLHLGNAVSKGNAKQLQLFRDQLRTFAYPTYVVPGNQDLARGRRADWENMFGQVPLSFRIDKDRFILLDNASGTLGAKQTAWLKRALQQANDEQARHIFVFLHAPLVDPRPGINQGMTSRREVRQLLALFGEHHVDTVFAGHVGMYARETRKGVTYVVTGGGGGPLDAPAAHGGFHHYLRVDVNGAAVNSAPVALKK